MGPIRAEKSYKMGESSSSSAQISKKRRRFAPKDTGNDASTLPGVQKLKSSLRQTRRLLAKENLAADVRVETERRLKALEADIVQAQSARKERAMSVRYHKVKFFERQKVVRKIGQTKKKLASTEKSSSSKKKKTENVLFELRVDLNYILHYPKSKKYISLFPSGVRQSNPDSNQPTGDHADTAHTDSQREEVRSWIRSRMEKGELEGQPELHLDSRVERGNTTAMWGADKEHKKAKMMHRGESVDITNAIEADDFFGDDSDEEENDGDGDGD